MSRWQRHKWRKKRRVNAKSLKKHDALCRLCFVVFVWCVRLKSTTFFTLDFSPHTRTYRHTISHSLVWWTLNIQWRTSPPRNGLGMVSLVFIRLSSISVVSNIKHNQAKLVIQTECYIYRSVEYQDQQQYPTHRHTDTHQYSTKANVIHSTFTRHWSRAS